MAEHLVMESWSADQDMVEEHKEKYHIHETYQVEEPIPAKESWVVWVTR